MATVGYIDTLRGELANANSAQSRTDVLKPKQYGPKVLQLRETISQPVVAAFCAGGIAGAVSRTVVSPLERLKILFQVQSVGREEYKLSVGKGLMKMWKDEGWRGFMRGNGTNCIRIVPYSAVQFGSYNFYKKVCVPSSQCGLISHDVNVKVAAYADPVR
jgi:solute carrier family 25 phosphate transporter 23/24/25/41